MLFFLLFVYCSLFLYCIFSCVTLHHFFFFIFSIIILFLYSFLLFILHFLFPLSISPYLCISSQASHYHNLTDFVTQVTPMVPISLETWSLSFAKYLELRFYGGSFNRRGTQGCTHSLHHDHFQYFGYKNQVAVFK